MPGREIVPFADRLVFGEGMRWYRGRLWMGDMLGRKVLAFDRKGEREIIAEVPGRPNGLGFLPDGRLIIASMADQRLLRREADGRIVMHSDLAAHMTGYTGDIAVDAAGRTYVDDVGFRVFEKEARRPGALLRVDPNGAATVLERNLQFPNGLWITADGQHLVFAEGRNETLFSYRLAADGSFADKRVFAAMKGHVLDGLTLDSHGAVWACSPYLRQVNRVLDGGRIAETIRFPDNRKPVACCLGGADRKTLFVVAADYTLERMAQDDTEAEIYRIDVDVPGFPLPGDTD
ncbi:MAG: SMP-30/gluconolactonase/LRE family protein [Rhodospirillaceae bacterium]|nr:SMP-30/gluconolactonase/LRE family protein [Rhodospirillaceae bacterium]